VATLDGGFTDTDGSDLRTQAGVVAVQYAQAESPVHQSGSPPDLDVSVVTAAGDQWLGLATWQSQALAQAQAIRAQVKELEQLLGAHQ
jgi:thiamine monophosphate kinase